MNPEGSSLQFAGLTRLNDPRWPQWKAIYDASFDVSERMSDAFLHSVLADQANGRGGQRLLAMMLAGEPDRVAGIAMYEVDCYTKVSYLGYLATRADVRSGGYGRAIYTEVLVQCLASGASLMLFEVEIPEVASARDAEHGEWAHRRIAWYRRQGALLLGGIHYLQTVDTGLPAVEMHLMAHLFHPTTPAGVFEAAKSRFGIALQQIGLLTLD